MDVNERKQLSPYRTNGFNRPLTHSLPSSRAPRRTSVHRPMSESSDRPANSNPSTEVTARVFADGVLVRKTASPHGGDAIAVYLTFESTREDRCTVRLADAIPEPLRGHEVEFHPRYDPVNWSREDGSVVYSTTLAPDGDRTTVYGVSVDDSDQVELFTAEPAVEVATEDAGEAPDGSPRWDGSDRFEFDASGTAGVAGVGSDATGSIDGGIRKSAEEPTGRHPSAGSGDPGRTEAEDPAEALVAAVQRRGLTPEERQALRNALSLDELEQTDRQLESLQEEVSALRREVASLDRQAADVDGLERRFDSLSASIEERIDPLSEDVDDLSAALEREARWRRQLQRSIGADPTRRDRSE